MEKKRTKNLKTFSLAVVSITMIARFDYPVGLATGERGIIAGDIGRGKKKNNMRDYLQHQKVLERLDQAIEKLENSFIGYLI